MIINKAAKKLLLLFQICRSNVEISKKKRKTFFFVKLENILDKPVLT